MAPNRYDRMVIIQLRTSQIHSMKKQFDEKTIDGLLYLQQSKAYSITKALEKLTSEIVNAKSGFLEVKYLFTGLFYIKYFNLLQKVFR